MITRDNLAPAMNPTNYITEERGLHSPSNIPAMPKVKPPKKEE